MSTAAGNAPDALISASARTLESLRQSVALPIIARRRLYRADIDGMRAIAVVCVLAYHAFPGSLTGGFTGVDIFFVISGYLITQLILGELHAGNFRLTTFYARRARRIFPALVIVLAAMLVFGWFALLRGELEWLGRSVAWSAPFLANVFFARAGDPSHYFAPGAELRPALHLWSLGVEEQFYLAWPLLLLLAARVRLILPTLAGVIVISLALSFWGDVYAPDMSFYLPVSRGWELATGGMIAALQPRSAAAHCSESISRRERVMRSTASAAGILLIAAGASLLRSSLTLQTMAGLTATGGAALLITAGPSAAVNRWLLANRAMVFVGQISYPLYLWHWPALSFLHIVTGRVPPPAAAAAVVLGSAAAAYLTWRFIEVPVRFGRARRFAVPVLFVALAVLTVSGAALDRGWIAGRLTVPPFSAWVAAAGDWNIPNVRRRNDLWTLTASSERRRTAVFIGDSHIQQYWPRIKHVIETHPADARSAVLATYTECPPLPGIASLLRGTACSASFRNAVADAYHPNVDTVVFGGFWEAYFLSPYQERDSPRPLLRVYLATDRLRRPLALDSAGTALVLDEFRRSILQLTQSGRRVFILLSNPASPRFDPLYLFPGPTRLMLRPPARLIVDEDKRQVDIRGFESFVAPMMDRLRRVAAAAGAKIIDPRESLCDGSICQTVGANGEPLYIDSNHLSSTFALERASFIDRILLDGSSATHEP